MHRRIFRRAPFVAAALAAALVAVFLSAAPASAATPNAVFTKVSDWGTGWEGKFVLTNSGSTAVDGWRVEFDLPEGSDIGAYWDAAMTRDGQPLHLHQPVLEPGHPARRQRELRVQRQPGRCRGRDQRVHGERRAVRRRRPRPHPDAR